MPFCVKRIFQMRRAKAFTSPMPLRSRYTSKTTKEEKTLTALETRVLYNFFRDQKQNLMAMTGVNAPDDSKVQELDNILAILEPKIKELHAMPFSGIMTDESLEYLNIRPGGNLILKPTGSYKERMDAAAHIGDSEPWSSELLYRHLCMLQGLVPSSNEAAARLWINAFFFRATAMLPTDKKMVLNVEHDISAAINPPGSTAVLKGFVDYTAIMAPQTDATNFLMHPTLEKVKEFKHAFFLSEVKSRDVSLRKNIPETVSEMYAWAKELGKTTIRGALSDGQKWIFFILKVNSDGNGAIYAVSREIPVIGLPELLPLRDACNLISGILSYWIQNSDKDIDDSDWLIGILGDGPGPVFGLKP